MNDDIKKIVEALLFATNRPISLKEFVEIIGNVNAEDMSAIIQEINSEYSAASKPYSIQNISSGYIITTNPECESYIRRLFGKDDERRLSKAALETLAIVAYNQPITRAKVESIRGVNSDQLIRGLLEKKFIRILPRDNSHNKSLLYGTTSRFLELLGINSLEDLPRSQELLPKEQVKEEKVILNEGGGS